MRSGKKHWKNGKNLGKTRGKNTKPTDVDGCPYSMHGNTVDGNILGVDSGLGEAGVVV